MSKELSHLDEHGNTHMVDVRLLSKDGGASGTWMREERAE